MKTHIATIMLKAAILLLTASPIFADRRPFYIIGHMVNSANLIEPFLDHGCNVLESDVNFQADGSVQGLYHGFPCDMMRSCYDQEDLGVYLNRVRELTSAEIGVRGWTQARAKKNYSGQLVMVFLDLKLSTSGNKKKSGRDIAEYLMTHLFTSDRIGNGQELRVLLYIESVQDTDFVLAFIDELKRRRLGYLLDKHIGFDCGTINYNKTRQMFANLAVSGNIWHGDGVTNIFRPYRGDKRLKQLLSIRDSPSGFIRKVYDWTVDKEIPIRKSLRLGVDGMITNEPLVVMKVLVEPEFKKKFRLATVADDPFECFEDNAI